MPKWTIILLILIVAIVFRFQNLATTPLQIVSAIAGVLTVLGLYLLTNRLLNWQIAAISSYLLAIEFWHVSFSRSGLNLNEIITSMLLVWGFYFLWRGLSSGQLWNFAASAVFWGLGFYTYGAIGLMPIVVVVTLLAYWQSIEKDFGHDKYEFTRNHLIRGLALFLVTAILVCLPVGYYFWSHSPALTAGTVQTFIFTSDNMLSRLANNTFSTLGSFNFIGDPNPQHGIPGQPILLWPIGIFFALGFLRSWIKLFKRAKTHGHLSTVQTLLLSWFFIGLIPTILSNASTPNSLSMLIVAPVVFIWAGEGLWWIIERVGNFYRARDPHEYNFHGRWLHERSVVAILALLILLTALTVAEYDKYFNTWVKGINTMVYRSAPRSLFVRRNSQKAFASADKPAELFVDKKLD